MYEEFIKEMYKAFSSVPKPKKSQMTPHRCPECDDIRDQLYEYTQRELPDKLLNYHGDALPLLSPEALHYYFPRYIEFSLLHQDANACDNVLYHLAPDEDKDYWEPRINIFTKEQKEIFIKYLEIRKTFEDAEFDEEYISKGLKTWV